MVSGGQAGTGVQIREKDNTESVPILGTAFSRQIFKALIYMDIVGHDGSQPSDLAIRYMGRFGDADKLPTGSNSDDRKQARLDGAADGFLGAAIERRDLPDGQKLAAVTAIRRVGCVDRLAFIGGVFRHVLLPL